QLARLLGWMSIDAGAEGRGQKYLIQASRLADEAGASTTRAFTLCGLYAQAARLGHHRPTLESPEDGIRGCHPRIRAAIATARAEALAASGDRKEALAVLNAAERVMERTNSRNELAWYEDIRSDLFAYWAGIVLQRLGDMKGAESYLVHS